MPTEKLPGHLPGRRVWDFHTSSGGRRQAYNPRGLGAGFVCSRSWVAISDWRIWLYRVSADPLRVSGIPRERASRLHLT